MLRNLPANCTAVGVPAEVVRINNKAVNPADDLDQQDLPDIVSQRLTDLDRRLSAAGKSGAGRYPAHCRTDRRPAAEVTYIFDKNDTGQAMTCPVSFYLIL